MLSFGLFDFRIDNFLLITRIVGNTHLTAEKCKTICDKDAVRAIHSSRTSRCAKCEKNRYETFWRFS